MTSDILQAASLYVDVAHAQLTGATLELEIAPLGYRIEVGGNAKANLMQAVDLCLSQIDCIDRQALIASGIDNLKRGGK